MVLPIYAYGQPVLKEEGAEIDVTAYPELNALIENMWETMRTAKGVGLAAQQVGLGIKLFVIDTTPYKDEDHPDFIGIRKVFINAHILEESGEEWAFEEGCLSIPDLRAEVDRPPKIEIEYENELGEKFKETYEGLNARVIQHEYDHTMGVLFVDHLKPLKKRMIQRKLEAIRKGQVEAEYRLRFYRSK